MDRNIALLIDSENVSADYMSFIIDEANKLGKVTYRRIYGDWTSDVLKSWKNKAIEYGLTPVQQYSYVAKKNASDFSLIIDAMDILYRGKVEGFCIVSSDSDFTRLVTRLKEDNQYVVGMGESKTPVSLVNSCESFIYLDKLLEQKKAASQPRPKKAPTEKIASTPKGNPTTESSIIPLDELLDALNDIINSNLNDEGWANWAQVANQLQKKFPGFNPRNYGAPSTPLNFFRSRKLFDFSHQDTLVLIRAKAQVKEID